MVGVAAERNAVGPSDAHAASDAGEPFGITVFLADDNLLIRQGVRSLIELADDLTVVGVAADRDELLDAAGVLHPQVLVTDIRMPPTFGREGIEAAKLLRKRHPGTGVVVLSQYDDPEYAVSLLAEGAAGYAYLLKDRVADGDQLARAIRTVATGGSMLDSKIVDALTRPVQADGQLTGDEETLLRYVAEGTPIKAIAVALDTTPADIDGRIDGLFATLAAGLSAGSSAALDRLRALHRAIMEREEQGETLSRLLPGGLADTLLAMGRRIGETEELTVSVLMSDIRSWSTLAEHTSPATLAGQLSHHRAAMTRAVLERDGTVMQFVGDAVIAVFGAPHPIDDHAGAAVSAALVMHESQRALNHRWQQEGLEPFGIGIGITTGMVAAALLGSEERMEYTVIGDTVNLAQRIQQWADIGETVLSEATLASLQGPVPACDTLEPALVRGRETPVRAHRFPKRVPA